MTSKKNHSKTEKSDQEQGDAEIDQLTVPDERDAAIENLNKELLYQAAEVENFKRRTEKRYADALKFACEPFARDLVGVVDNLERALDHAVAENAAISEGLGHILTQLRATLVRHGVEEIAAEGVKFDPNFHEALAMVPGDADGLVVSVHEKGYTIHGKLLRPSKVIVSRLAQPLGDG